MTIRRNFWRCAVVALVLSPLAAQAPPAPRSSTPQSGQLHGAAVVAHLERVIAWYREVDGLNTSAGAGADIVLRDSAHQSALGALQLAFDFARAEAAFKAAALHPEQEGDAGTGTTAGHNMQQVASRAAARVTGLQTRIDDLDAAIAKAPARSHALLEAQRRQLTAELSLAREIQKTVQGMVSFAGSGAAGGGVGGGLAGQINDLQNTVPESFHTPGKSGAPPKPSTVTSPPEPQAASEGLIGLATDFISESRARLRMKDLLASTDALLKNIDELKGPVVGALRESIQKSDQMTAASGSETLEQLSAGQKEIDARVAQFKQLSTVTVPLSEEQILLENCRGALVEWNSAIAQQYGIVGRYLVTRAVMLVAAIFLILLCSQIWRRATLRLIRDSRRQKQILVLRRVVVSLAIAVAVTLGFVSQFGSVATYAGFLTAGLAVALQNVILAVVAYFFLVGRFGVSVGDRVTISGVTGDVIDLGLVRLYLMEFTGSGADLHPTGRVVVFSNAILFQPVPIYKQLPGTNYVWHAVMVTLSAETNPQEAEKRLGKAVSGVYDQYRPAIERQHKELERSVDLPVDAPVPFCQVRFTDAGLEFRARYPVEFRRTADIDDQVIKALQTEIAREPRLTLAPSGMPKVQSSPA